MAKLQFNRHPKIEGTHAFLSPSQHAWVMYDDEKLQDVYLNWRKAQQGTALHELAAKLIDLRIEQKRIPKTFNMYVNDAIGFRMNTEVCLFYSFNSYGTADAISFDGDVLRIHDLKTGRTPASIQQLRIYAALFCLEYGFDPRDISMELRIYQNDEINMEHPNPEDIRYIMDKLVAFDKRIQEMNGQQ